MRIAVLPPRVVAALPKMRRAATVRLAVAIGIYTYKGRSQCFPSQASLMRAGGIATDGAFRSARKELIDLGLLKYQASGGGHVQGGKARTSLYEWVDPQKIRPEDRDSTPPLGRGVAKGGVKAVYPPAPQLSTPLFDDRLPPSSTVGGRCLEDATTKMFRGAAGADRGPAPVGQNVWAWWIDANRNADRADPAKHGPDLKAAKTIGQFGFSDDEVKRLLRAFLADGDRLLVSNGHALRLLPGKVNAYRNGPPCDVDPLAHIDFGKKVSP